jgi:hypothetical protein
MAQSKRSLKRRLKMRKKDLHARVLFPLVFTKKAKP